MKAILLLLSLILVQTATAQSELDFDMDVTDGFMGGYADVTYTITNISTNTFTNLTITHPDALNTSITLNPSTLAPGVTITATNRIALSGDLDNGQIPVVQVTQAMVSGFNGTVTVTEQSDGLNSQRVRVEDGASVYNPQESPSYGVIYLDLNANSRYDAGIDSPLPNVRINLYDNLGNTDFMETNETGWWYYASRFAGNAYSAVIDVNTFPTSTNSYTLVEGETPFIPNGPLAFNFRVSHGYTTTNFGTIEASSFLDSNGNGSRDTGEMDVPFIDFEFIKNNDPSSSVTINNGFGSPVRRVDLNPGVQLNDINASLASHQSLYTITNANYDDILTTVNAVTAVPFAVTENAASNRDTAVLLTTIVPPNPGFNSRLEILINNIHAGNSTGMLQFNHDPIADLVAVYDRSGTNILANGTATATASGFSLPYSVAAFGQYDLEVVLSTPVTGVQMGDIFIHTASINPTTTDSTSSNNNTVVNAVVVASYDPNDVTEVRGPNIPINTFASGDLLEYTIRFQNLGTASAQFVRVLSSLDAMLDPNTFEIIASSHSYILTKDGSELDFLFENIQLAPESLDEAGSNGYIKYKIKPNSGYAVGDIIAATASIFFDYNPAVITETWTTTFDAPASISDLNLETVLYPIPLNGNKLFTNIQEGVFTIYDLKGSKIDSGTIINGMIHTELNQGLYMIIIKSNQGLQQFKLIKE
ncbi:MAG: T9SS type A sorting domain-containing protein [Nonlabens sp.]|nr:T9SS type A sorting domain-containing protein [Nonlabens sp.]